MKGASEVSYAIVSEYIYLFIRKSNWFLDNREQNKNQETFNSEARPKGGNTRYNFFALTTQSARIQGSLVMLITNCS